MTNVKYKSLSFGEEIISSFRLEDAHGNVLRAAQSLESISDLPSDVTTSDTVTLICFSRSTSQLAYGGYAPSITLSHAHINLEVGFECHRKSIEVDGPVARVHTPNRHRRARKINRCHHIREELGDMKQCMISVDHMGLYCCHCGVVDIYFFAHPKQETILTTPRTYELLMQYLVFKAAPHVRPQPHRQQHLSRWHGHNRS